MYSILNNRYVLKSGAYIADLTSVDFITWRQDAETKQYRMKMHIGSKEVRYLCDTLAELENVLSNWTEMQGKEIAMEHENIGEKDEFIR